jgi:dolichol-phosphate mannosyltransferase
LSKKIAIVVPVYNECANLPTLYERLSGVIGKLPQFDWELFFVNDGSHDDSLETLRTLAKRDQKVKVIDLSRNFGKEVALSAGLFEEQGSDAVICIDADLQHPPEIIPQLIEAWEAGAEMVITVRATSKDETAFRRISSSLYYWLFNKISSIPITPKSTDFRLFDKKIVSQFLRMTERNRMFRGIMDWMGFKRAYVSFHADARVGGKSTFSFLRLMHLAITSVTSFSLLPLRITGYLGLLITFCSGGMMLWMAFNYLINSSLNFTPLAIVTVANTFLIGIVLMSIGLVALYVGTIHTEVVNRPLYMVRERINLME